MFSRRFGWTAVMLALVALAGCSEVMKALPTASWHQKLGWKAEDYFDDPQVIALCRAIQANDLAEIDRLVAAGANVNAQGKGKMTPLLWAYPDNKLERFKRLLEHGADPNEVFDGDFKARGWLSIGDSVTHMACETKFPGYFEAVFEHGGDPNLKRNSVLGNNQGPLFTVILGNARDKKAKVRLLIDKGANINQIDAAGHTPTVVAATWGHFDIALTLLKAGADPRIYNKRGSQKLTHYLARQARQQLKFYTPEQRLKYDELEKWLEDHGESVEQARADIKRWDSWPRPQFPGKMAAEIREREAREKEAAAAKQDAQDGQ